MEEELEWVTAFIPEWSLLLMVQKTRNAELHRVLHNDPAMGVIRHADAGYDIALDTARKFKLDLAFTFEIKFWSGN